MNFGIAADIQRVGPDVYAVTLEDELLCIDWKTGELVWKSETGLPNHEFSINSTPAVSGDRIFFGALDGILYALDANAGTILWKRELADRVTTSILLVGGTLYAGSSNRHVYRVETKTGAVTADLAVDDIPTGRLLFAEDSLIVFFGDKKLACLDSSLRAIRWSQAATSAPWSSARPYAWRHTVLAGNEKGEVLAFRISDGRELWSGTFEGVIRGIGSSEEALYVGTLKGRISAWMPAR